MMGRLGSIGLGLCLLGACSAASRGDVPVASADAAAQLASSRSTSTQELVSANHQFAWALYRQLAAADGNVFFCPFSLDVALTMTLAGARGETAAQMREVLALPADAQMQAAAGRWQRAVLPAPDDSLVTFTVANRLWAQRDFVLAPEFTAATRDHHGAEVGEVDFRHDRETARRTINDWVADATRGRIEDLVPAGALDDRTRLVLANAVYFLGTWRHTFDEADTEDQPFHAATGDAAVPMMSQQGRLPYAEVDGAQVLELPYRAAGDVTYSMVIVLPRERGGLAALTAAMAADSLATWIARLDPREVRVQIPRFELTARASLRDVLTTLGMPLAFSGDADFSGMLAAEAAGGAPLAISDVLHKAFVKVDEHGTEAAAATGVIMGITSVPMREEPVIFRADHPFLFLIRETRTGTVLFLGRFAGPAS